MSITEHAMGSSLASCMRPSCTVVQDARFDPIALYKILILRAYKFPVALTLQMAPGFLGKPYVGFALHILE
jgi:hypothetical protein